jgi:hypothetical protein
VCFKDFHCINHNNDTLVVNLYYNINFADCIEYIYTKKKVSFLKQASLSSHKYFVIVVYYNLMQEKGKCGPLFLKNCSLTYTHQIPSPFFEPKLGLFLQLLIKMTYVGLLREKNY